MSKPADGTAPGVAARPRPPARRRRRLLVALAGLLVLGALLREPAGRHLRAAALLLRFADPNAAGAIAEHGRHAVDEARGTLSTPHGDVPARLYTPAGAPGAPGIVLLHGVHRLGIEEPRLVRFARAIAGAGLVVLTPEVSEIADYRVDARSIETIGSAAQALRARVGRRPGVMGMCFAGSLSLLAAADARFSEDVGFVVSVGAHHDLARVFRFFAQNEAERPDGTKERMKAHEYGALVLVYAHVENFFPEDDVPIAREALRLWLAEERGAARASAEDLGPEARARMQQLFEGRIDAIAPELLAEVAAHEQALRDVSPRGRLGGVRAPVFLLHGAGDTVIPATELAWLVGEVPPGRLRQALVSPAILHVEIHGEPGAGEQWDLVHFMAGVLDEAGAAPP